jgi:DNA-binding HxlR family transcriptional regulator
MQSYIFTQLKYCTYLKVSIDNKKVSMAIKESSTNNENKKVMQEICPVIYTMSKIGGRWKPVILYHLQNKPLRYGVLKKEMSTISEKMFIQHLRELEADNLVAREVVYTVPPQVTYSLTKNGNELIPILNEMSKWGKKHQ